MRFAGKRADGEEAEQSGSRWLASLSGPVWAPASPTSGAAEISATVATIQIASTSGARLPREVVTDYQTAVALMDPELPLRSLLHPARLFAGTLRDMQSQAAWGGGYGHLDQGPHRGEGRDVSRQRGGRRTGKGLCQQVERADGQPG